MISIKGRPRGPASQAGQPQSMVSYLLQARLVARRAFVTCFVFSIGINLLYLVTPIYSLQVYDRVLLSRSTETLIYLSIVMVGVFGVLVYLDHVRTKVLSLLTNWWIEALEPAVVRGSIVATLRGEDASHQASSDLRTVASAFASPGVIMLMDVLWMPLFVAAMFLLHWMLGVFTVVLAVLSIILAVLNEVLTKRRIAEAYKEQAAAQEYSQAIMRGADALTAMGLVSTAVEKLNDRTQKFMRLTEGSAVHTRLIQGLAKYIRMVGQSGVLGLGAYLVIENQLTGGGMFAAMTILGRALAPVDNAIGSWRTLQMAREAYRRLGEVLARTPAPDLGATLPARGAVSAENVTFMAPGRSEPVLRNVTFAVKPGETLAVLGPSASGKSTLCRLLVGSWRPAGGDVRIDGAPPSQWNEEALGKAMGYVPQSVELFPGTIRENIGRLTDASDADVIDAATRAGCHEMILRLPKGYDTIVGPTVPSLSGGQRQRIALARALFGHPKLLVLDEPNSNLDQDGEAALLRALAEAKKAGTTVILVAHRPNMLVTSDKVLIMKEGRVERFGDTKQIFAQMRAQQAQAQRREGAPPAMAVVNEG